MLFILLGIYLVSASKLPSDAPKEETKLFFSRKCHLLGKIAHYLGLTEDESPRNNRFKGHNSCGLTWKSERFFSLDFANNDDIKSYHLHRILHDPHLTDASIKGKMFILQGRKGHKYHKPPLLIQVNSRIFEFRGGILLTGHKLRDAIALVSKDKRFYHIDIDGVSVNPLEVDMQCDGYVTCYGTSFLTRTVDKIHGIHGMTTVMKFEYLFYQDTGPISGNFDSKNIPLDLNLVPEESVGIPDTIHNYKFKRCFLRIQSFMLIRMLQVLTMMGHFDFEAKETINLIDLVRQDYSCIPKDKKPRMQVRNTILEAVNYLLNGTWEIQDDPENVYFLRVMSLLEWKNSKMIFYCEEKDIKVFRTFEEVLNKDYSEGIYNQLILVQLSFKSLQLSFEVKVDDGHKAFMCLKAFIDEDGVLTMFNIGADVIEMCHYGADKRPLLQNLKRHSNEEFPDFNGNGLAVYQHCPSRFKVVKSASQEESDG